MWLRAQCWLTSVPCLALVLLNLASCNSESPSKGRVLLVGIDGATLRVVSPLLKKDRLPNLASIARAGVAGKLRSTRPLYSPAIWTSIATGKTRKKHGISSFVRRDPEVGKRLNRSSDREVHALWNIASDAGLTVGVVNWWLTFPIEKIRGIMLSDHALPGQSEGRGRFFKAVIPTEGAVVFPVDWTQRLSTLLADDEALTEIEDPFRNNNALPPWVLRSILSESYQRDQMTVRIALAVDEEIHPDLLMVYMNGIDPVSHMLWGNLEPQKLYPEELRPSSSQRSAGIQALYRYYRYIDALIGLLLERFGPQDLVMVVSDHGFEGGRATKKATGRHESERAQDGIIFASGDRIVPGAEVGSVTVNDITPTILAWLGLPVADDMDGVPAPFLSVGQVRRIPTYDTTPIERVDAVASGAEEEILEDLRALGYIE